MPTGKTASQAGHAFLDAFLRADPALQSQYQAEGHGTKVVLSAPDEDAIQGLFNLAQEYGLPSALIVDSGHVLPPHFSGAPIVTAVGIGPMTRQQADRITRGLGCL